MIRFRRCAGLASVAIAASVVVAAAPGRAQAQVASLAASVSCIAPSTGPAGPTGATGADGDTGPQGPQGATGEPGFILVGPHRVTHARGLDLPDCTELVGLCVTGTQAGPIGPTGPQGATGAQGPQGATGPTGPSLTGTPRIIHVKQVDPCSGIPSNCRFGIVGPQGASGPQGPTGASGEQGQTGPTGPASPVGPRRAAHVRPAGLEFPSGGVVTLDNCQLANTGAGPVSMLPYALLLVALGGVVLMFADRRRTLARLRNNR